MKTIIAIAAAGSLVNFALGRIHGKLVSKAFNDCDTIVIDNDQRTITSMTVATDSILTQHRDSFMNKIHGWTYILSTDISGE